uniref:Large ribosomal subunit protein bL32c n=1 Tax=Crouania attenuata TaxID=42002 RepID=A0A4D6WQ92_9FLOR|nr:ribosomal protein L32 [Crouania attenuata]
MAVPKKRVSKSKSGKNKWKKKAFFVGQKSLSLAKSLLTGRATSFIYIDQVNNNLETED